MIIILMPSVDEKFRILQFLQVVVYLCIYHKKTFLHALLVYREKITRQTLHLESKKETLNKILKAFEALACTTVPTLCNTEPNII